MDQIAQIMEIYEVDFEKIGELGNWRWNNFIFTFH